MDSPPRALPGARIFTGAAGFAPAPGSGGAAAAFGLAAAPRGAKTGGGLGSIGAKPVSSYSIKAPAKMLQLFRPTAPVHAPAPGPVAAIAPKSKSFSFFG
jgi:hypothetical protein